MHFNSIYGPKHSKKDQIDDPSSFFKSIVSEMLSMQQKLEFFCVIFELVARYGPITIEQPWTA